MGEGVYDWLLLRSTALDSAQTWHSRGRRVLQCGNAQHKNARSENSDDEQGERKGPTLAAASPAGGPSAASSKTRTPLHP